MKGATATQSGVYTLPFVLSLVVASTLSGAFTQRFGYYVPAMIASPSLLAVGQGLMSTFTVDTPSSHWIGFQVIAGFGLGLGMQAASLAAQAVLPLPDVPIGIAIMFFAQQLGGGIFTSVGQNLLSTYLVSNLHIPGLSTDQITSEGATELVSSVAPEYQLTVKTIYNQAINQIFRCAMGVALGAVVAALFMEWKNVKKAVSPPGGGLVQRVPSPENVRSEESSGMFIDVEMSPKASSDNHSNLDRKYKKSRVSGGIFADPEELPRTPPPKSGCEHCEHCRLSRALTIAPSDRNSLSPPPLTSRLQPLAPPTNTPSPEALEEAARLATIAREAVAQLEELTRPFSIAGAAMGRHSIDSALAHPERAYFQHNAYAHHSSTAPEIPPRRQRREPTTQELVENARRVSAQLEREDRDERARHHEGWKERHESMGRHSEQSSRPLSAIMSSASPSSQSSSFLPHSSLPHAR